MLAYCHRLVDQLRLYGNSGFLRIVCRTELAGCAWHIFHLVQTDPKAGWVFVLDNLNVHCDAPLVCYVAELEEIDRSTLGGRKT